MGNDLSSRVDVLQSELSSGVDKVNNRVDGLKSELAFTDDVLNSKMLDFETNVHGLITDVTGLSGDVSNLNNQIDQPQLNHETPLAFFSASRTTNGIFNPGDTIVFEQVETNVFPGNSGGYDPNTGIFTCAIGGYYIFHVTIFKAIQTEHDNQVRLIKSGSPYLVELNNSRSEDMDDNLRWSSTMHCITPCEQGQQVYVEMYSGGGHVIGNKR